MILPFLNLFGDIKIPDLIRGRLVLVIVMRSRISLLPSSSVFVEMFLFIVAICLSSVLYVGLQIYLKCDQKLHILVTLIKSTLI